MAGRGIIPHPWLALPENITLLGETIGIEFEVEAQEQSVGPFSADILSRDTINGHWALIENQLERTDHSHLDQFLTHATKLDAVTIVWITSRFTEEHRAELAQQRHDPDARCGKPSTLFEKRRRFATYWPISTRVIR